jgi:hypothetical protein
MQTPVAFIIFKRPHTTEKVFQAIRQAKPSKLFVIADGARLDRLDNLDEAEKCEATRAIIDKVDWECEVFKNYSDVNLGCGKRLPSGLDWVFEHVEEAIILEDDCVPNPTFFPFCEELLDKYRHDYRVASISGQNVQFGRKRTEYSYYFSRYNHCWGWATWKRSWKNFDSSIKHWKEIQEGGFLKDILIEPQAVRYWTKIFQSLYDQPSDKIWDFHWTFACWLQNSLGIISNVNLISNIGFGEDSTHFKTSKNNPYINIQAHEIEFPLKHPQFVFRDVDADTFTQRTLFREYPLAPIKKSVKNFLKKAYQQNKNYLPMIIPTK